MPYLHSNQQYYEPDLWDTADVYGYGQMTEIETVQNPVATQVMGVDIYAQLISGQGWAEDQAVPTLTGYGDSIHAIEFGNLGGTLSHQTAIPIEQFEHLPSPTQIPSDALLGSPQIASATSLGNQTSCLQAPCRWRPGHEGICGVSITCEEVPAHFKKVHNIRDIPETESINCRWEGRTPAPGRSERLSRKNFVRHVRE